jgi:HSP20 family protein
MALPRPAGSWTQGLDFPSRLFESGSSDYELDEEDGAFVLTVELPGFDPEEITASWDSGVLNVAGEHEDEARGARRTYHRRFRFPKTIDEDDIEATHQNGVLTVRFPVVVDAAVTGTEIESES